MKIVFLDIDGVINTRRTTLRASHVFYTPLADMNKFAEMEPFDRFCIERINKITDATRAKIVISSSWRYLFKEEEEWPYFTKFLKVVGLTGEVIGRTPIGKEYVNEMSVEDIERGHEIQMWLDKHKGKIESFVILDDNSDMAHLKERLVQTPSDIGIQDEDAERAIRYLNIEL